jgi:hypothetical protein
MQNWIFLPGIDFYSSQILILQCHKKEKAPQNGASQS